MVRINRCDFKVWFRSTSRRSMRLPSLKIINTEGWGTIFKGRYDEKHAVFRVQNCTHQDFFFKKPLWKPIKKTLRCTSYPGTHYSQIHAFFQFFESSGITTTQINPLNPFQTYKNCPKSSFTSFKNAIILRNLSRKSNILATYPKKLKKRYIFERGN